MFVNKVGLPVQGVDGNANLAQCVIEQHELAILRRSVEPCELLEAMKTVFFFF